MLDHPVPRRVAVLRALSGLGDMLCLVPALRALRTALPDAHVTLVGLPAAASILERFGHYVDELVPLPGWPGLPEGHPDVAELVPFLAAMHGRDLDLVLQLHGSGVVTNPLAALLGGDRMAGFYLPGQYCPDPARFLPYLEDEPEVRRPLRLLAHLGMPAGSDALELPLGADDDHALAAIPEAAALQRADFACVHPGANHPDRRWSPERFAVVGDALAARGLTVVLTGLADDAPVAMAVMEAMDAPALDLTGRTSLGALAALVAQSRLVVANDTGVSHLAAALAVPSVIVFTGSDPRRWAPLDRARHRPVVATSSATSVSATSVSASRSGPRGGPSRDRSWGQNAVVGEAETAAVVVEVDALLAAPR